MHLFFFPRSYIIFIIITLNSFPGDCLSFPHLVVLLGFYRAPSFATYFSVISFCLNFCVCGLPSAGCRTIVLAFGFCPLTGEADLEACVINPLTGGVVTSTCPGC